MGVLFFCQHFCKYCPDTFSCLLDLLTAWFLAGCKTLSECKKKYADDEEAKKAEREAKTGTKKTKKEPERYGDFDANEAFLKALERSYGTDK